MRSTKRLRSVCHSIAHHSVSGLSFLHPHLLSACRRSGIDELVVSLLDKEPCPVALRGDRALASALVSLRAKLESILASEDLSLAELSKARLTFAADTRYSDDCATVCRAELALASGGACEYTVDCLGASPNFRWSGP
jgi:hypothetical protein